MKIVKKIEPETDRKQVLCTTYQMRNCFKQFADGVASELDVHCYFQHAFAADLMPNNGRVLDVCCGRGMLLPFLRYRSKQCDLYVGVDIEPKNAIFRDGGDPRRPTEKKDWGFRVEFVKSNVDDMANNVSQGPFDLIVYTSAIEHMQPISQQASLVECRKLATKKSTLYVTCPVTPKGQNGYAAQYAAHVYEPKENELTGWLNDAGWNVKRRVGLSTGCNHFRSVLTASNLAGAEYLYSIMPREQALPTIAAMYPQAALEMAYVCQ